MVKKGKKISELPYDGAAPVAGDRFPFTDMATGRTEYGTFQILVNSQLFALNRTFTGTTTHDDVVIDPGESLNGQLRIESDVAGYVVFGNRDGDQTYASVHVTSSGDFVIRNSSGQAILAYDPITSELSFPSASVKASSIDIDDVAENFTATDVEAALAELVTLIGEGGGGGGGGGAGYTYVQATEPTTPLEYETWLDTSTFTSWIYYGGSWVETGSTSVIPVPEGLAATGTPASSTFLRGDGTWAAPVGTNLSYNVFLRELSSSTGNMLTLPNVNPGVTAGLASPTDGLKINAVKPGGTAGQVLGKISGTDYDTAWITPAGGSGLVDSVNGEIGAVVLDADDIDDTSTTNKFATAAQLAAVDGLASTYQPLDADLTALAAAGNSATLAATTASFTTTKDSKLAGIEAGADQTDTANVTAAGALMDSEVTNLAAVKAFDPTDYATAAQGATADTALQPGDIGSTVQGYDADTLKADTADTLTAGFDSTDFAAGTKSSGTYTPAASDGNFQVATNGGAHTLAPPTTSCSIVIHYTNNGSAGTITTSGFTAVTGDSFTTTDTHEFVCVITKINDVSVLNVTALQ